jgi:hypothetical protein
LRIETENKKSVKSAPPVRRVALIYDVAHRKHEKYSIEGRNLERRGGKTDYRKG